MKKLTVKEWEKIRQKCWANQKKAVIINIEKIRLKSLSS